jgi:hypothetical protein
VSAVEIAARLGRARREGRGWRTECPVHHGHSLNLADGRDGKLLVTCWAGCAAEEIFDELRRLDLDTWPEREPEERQKEDGGEHTRWAQQLWDRARDARRSPVERYLRSRGITIPPPPSLRWTPSCKHPSGVYLPAMIAKVVNVDDEFVAVHRTFLLPDGSDKAAVDKADQRRSLGPVTAGAVRLSPLDPDRALIVGEGIESVFSLMQLRGLPGWAALSTSGLKNLMLPRAVKRVLIAVDHDKNGTGEAAAREAGHRWLLEDREVRLARPPGFGDWNDVLRGKCDA